MDLKNLETTSTLAIEAVYKSYWDIIPEKYKLVEKAQRQPDDFPPKPVKSTPLTYKGVEKLAEPENEKDDYEIYCEMLQGKRVLDLQPFYDPQLDFENRLHYKLAGIEYPKRNKPWFVITWNCNNGILKSSLTNRRFETASVRTLAEKNVKFDFIDSEMDVTLCFNSNNLQALFELQEIIRISRREKYTITAKPHSILTEFPVILQTIDTGNIAKSARDKSTLCNLTLTIRIEYPVIGNVQSTDGIGIIKEFHTEYDRPMGEGPNTHEVLARDIVKEE